MPQKCTSCGLKRLISYRGKCKACAKRDFHKARLAKFRQDKKSKIAKITKTKKKTKC